MSTLRPGRSVSRLVVVGTAAMTETVPLLLCTGCPFSVTWQLLVGAKVHGNSIIREPCGENKGGTVRQNLGWAWV